MDAIHRLYRMRSGIQRVYAQMGASGVGGFAVKSTITVAEAE